MSKKLLSIFVLILLFSFTTQALASFTFSSSAITGTGVTSVNTGSLLLSGSTSGTVTIAPAAVAGTYTLTLPTDDGTLNQVLTTDGSGTLTWTTPLQNTATGTNNLGILTDALSSLTTGVSNISLGSYTLSELTTGSYNIAIGEMALNEGPLQQHTIAIGYRAGQVSGNDDAYGSIYIGKQAGQYAAAGATTGDDNVIIGNNAASSVELNSTIAIGYGTLENVYTVASGNIVAIGYQAGNRAGGNESWNGSYNTFLGANTGIQKDGGFGTTTDNVTLVGYGAYVNYLSPNTVVLGNASVTDVLAGSTALATVKAGALQLTTKADPTCSVTTRGQFWFLAGAGGVKDTVNVCAKDAGDAYAWRVIY